MMVRVLEELREKLIRLEAEVDAGRREHEAWYGTGFPSSVPSRSLMTLTPSFKNDNTANSSSPPSKTPISITKHLSELRLTHARLLEEHSVTTALLHRKFGRIPPGDVVHP
jgi:mitotic spindle assembly checkpoint protein MAD1